MNVFGSGWAAAVALLAAGCSSPLFEGSIFDQRGGERQQNELAQIKTSSELTSRECQRLSEQIDALNRNQQLLDSRLRGLEVQLSSGTQTQQDIAALRSELERVRVDRERLRAQITEDLAGKIEKVAARQQPSLPSTPRPPAAAAETPPSAARTGYEHKVERGQTLSEIARGYNTTVDKIIKANNIKDPATIRVGQSLFIPD